MGQPSPNRWLKRVLAAAYLAAPAVAWAQPPAPAPVFRTQQEQNARLFAEFKAGLLRLAQKLQRSDRPEDLDRAKTILAALDLAAKENVDSQFQKLLGAMSRGTGNVGEVQGMIGQDQQLTKVLQEILSVLMTDDESARLKAEIERLEAHVKDARELKRLQEIARSLSEARRTDAERLAEQQRALAERTRDLAERMGGKATKKPDPAKAGPATPKPVEKAEAKEGSKDGDGVDRAKPDTAEARGEAKPAGEKEPAPSKAGPPKPEAPPEKAGAKSGPDAEPKENAAKETPPADAAGEKPSDTGADAGEAAKPAEKPAAQSKGEGEQPKPQEPGAAKPSESANEQPPTGKPSTPPDAQAKGRAEGKADAKPPAGEKGGDAKSPPPQGGAKPSAQGKGEKPPQGPPGPQPDAPQSAQKPQQPPAPGRKKIEEAVPNQRDAADDLKKNQREQAGKGQDKAIQQIAEAIQELEKRLKQLREEEAQKVLANLESRVNRLLAMQTDVYESTKSVDAAVQRNGGSKGASEIQKAQQQGDQEGKIVEEADKTLKLLEAEGSAVAFAQVLQEVRGDMVAVQRRLGGGDVGRDTQAVEENILAMLRDMAAAVKKAQQELQQRQAQGGGEGGGGEPPPKPLIDMIGELRLIRALQLQVNSRTVTHGAKSAAEQASDPFVRGEIQQLSDRQRKLEEMVRKIVSGENK